MGQILTLTRYSSHPASRSDFQCRGSKIRLLSEQCRHMKVCGNLRSWACKILGRKARPKMIVGTGIDIAEVPRIRQSIERFGDRFLQRVFTARRNSLLRFQGESLRTLRRPLCRQGSRDEGVGNRVESWGALARLRSNPHARRAADYRVSRKGRRVRGQTRNEKCRAVDHAHCGTGASRR